MPMSTAYLNATATHGGSLITHIGLVNQSGTEIVGGSYARQAVTWTAVSAGLIRPTANLSFAIPAGTTVGGWRGYSAATSGTDYGGANVTQETFAVAGTYILDSTLTAIDHDGL